MSRWFRHYAGMCRDDKLVRAALRSKQPIERVIWVWAAILESASEVNDSGRYDFDVGEASYFLRSDEDDVRRIYDALEGLERIREGVVVRWGDRQYSSDNSAERQRRHRDRKKTSDQDNSHDVVTVLSRDGDAPELETETELETEKKYITDVGTSDAIIRIEREKKKRAEEISALRLLGTDWNSLAADCRLAQIDEIKPGSPREKHALARIRECAPMAIAFTKIRGSPFLRGDTSAFRVSFDWITTPANLAKVLEGNYDEVRQTKYQHAQHR